MSDGATPLEPESPTDEADREAEREADRKRRRRLAAVFGDVLPDTTSDERDLDTTPQADDEAQDRWLRSQVPPHHG